MKQMSIGYILAEQVCMALLDGHEFEEADVRYQVKRYWVEMSEREERNWRKENEMTHVGNVMR